MKYISKQHLQSYSYIDCKLCTHQCECVGTKISGSSSTEDHVSRNFRIKIDPFISLSICFCRLKGGEPGINNSQSKNV